jgi:hypothetical protein
MQENKGVPIFEPKYLNEVEVAEITNLFIEMNSATVTTMVIKVCKLHPLDQMTLISAP